MEPRPKPNIFHGPPSGQPKSPDRAASKAVERRIPGMRSPAAGTIEGRYPKRPHRRRQVTRHSELPFRVDSCSASETASYDRTSCCPEEQVGDFRPSLASPSGRPGGSPANPSIDRKKRRHSVKPLARSVHATTDGYAYLPEANRSDAPRGGAQPPTRDLRKSPCRPLPPPLLHLK